MKRPSTPTVETVTVDVIEEPAPGVVTITEFEEAEVREEGEGLERPEETPPGIRRAIKSDKKELAAAVQKASSSSIHGGP